MKGNTGARIDTLCLSGVFQIHSNTLSHKVKTYPEIGSKESKLYPRKCGRIFRRTQ